MQIDQATFRNSYADELPGEAQAVNRPRQVPGYCYSRVDPTPVSDPHLLGWSDEMGELLGLERPEVRGPAVDVLAGNLVTPTMKPFAARYGGHQFGSWAGQLGDGRAISLGELTARDGSSWEVQLKGAGRTPYSRQGDGRAVLRSSLREFLCSEAMHYLGVPTTRALSLVGTGDAVIRDMFYMGDPRPEPGAVVARVAPTFIRFGHFEILMDRREPENLRLLADYVLRHHYSELGAPSQEAYLAMFSEICRRTAVMIAHWMAVGFVHGVMNTDNMAILGVTIDYGPYGWLEPYDPDWTPNTTDFSMRRYTYGQQPGVALWNLKKLANALSVLAPDEQGLTLGLEVYRSTFLKTHREMTCRKLGLRTTDHPGDDTLLGDLWTSLEGAEMDMTLFFRKLSHVAPTLVEGQDLDPGVWKSLIDEATYATSHSAAHDSLIDWLHRYRDRLRDEATSPEVLRESMLAANPRYVLRNYLAQEAIESAERGDLSRLETLFSVLKRPYDEQPEHESLSARRPEWARTRPGCATLSCSS